MRIAAPKARIKVNKLATAAITIFFFGTGASSVIPLDFEKEWAFSQLL